MEIRSLRLIFGKDYKKLGELVLSLVQHFIPQTDGQSERTILRHWKEYVEGCCFGWTVTGMNICACVKFLPTTIVGILASRQHLRAFCRSGAHRDLLMRQMDCSNEKLKEARSRQKIHADKHHIQPDMSLSLSRGTESIRIRPRESHENKVFFCEDSLKNLPSVRLPGRPKSLCELVAF
ncbi:hypothetical protein Tco_0780386 [Tanacetum coccineum]